MHALLNSRAVMAMGAYAIGWMLAPVLAVDRAPEEATRTAPIAKLAPTEVRAADAQLAAWLAVDHESEIAISQVARERAQDETVRAFAQVMVDDHTRFVQELRPFAGTLLSQLDQGSREAALAAKSRRGVAPAAGVATDAAQTPSRYPALAAPRERAHDPDVYLLEVKRALGLQRIASTQVLFEEQAREEFDRCYLQQQIAAHRQMLDTLLVFKGRASTELATLLDEAVSTTKTHLEHAERLAETLDASPSVTAFLPRTSVD